MKLPGKKIYDKDGILKLVYFDGIGRVVCQETYDFNKRTAYRRTGSVFIFVTFTNYIREEDKITQVNSVLEGECIQYNEKILSKY